MTWEPQTPFSIPRCYVVWSTCIWISSTVVSKNGKWVLVVPCFLFGSLTLLFSLSLLHPSIIIKIRVWNVHYRNVKQASFESQSRLKRNACMHAASGTGGGGGGKSFRAVWTLSWLEPNLCDFWTESASLIGTSQLRILWIWTWKKK